jgi:hypothetical protein
MKVNLLGLTVAVVVLSIVYFGCGVVEDKTVSDSKVGAATKSVLPEETTVTFAAKPKKKLTLEIDNGKCTATVEEHPDGKVKKGSIKITTGQGPGTGQCQIEETDSLKINGETVVDIGPAQFTTQGSCKYCYINSTGGMTCVKYNVTPCP